MPIDFSTFMAQGITQLLVICLGGPIIAIVAIVSAIIPAPVSIILLGLLFIYIIVFITFKTHQQKSLILRLVFSLIAILPLALEIIIVYLPQHPPQKGFGISLYIPLIQLSLKNNRFSNVLIHIISPYILGIILIVWMTFTMPYIGK
ncbi:MAG: hypothetical protein WCR55_03795 [Lentisphaerota bacterium]